MRARVFDAWDMLIALGLGVWAGREDLGLLLLVAAGVCCGLARNAWDRRAREADE